MNWLICFSTVFILINEYIYVNQSAFEPVHDILVLIASVTVKAFFPIIKRLAIILMYCSRMHAWWSTQSRLASLLFSLIARQWVGLQTLWWFRLKDLFIDEMVGV